MEINDLSFTNLTTNILKRYKKRAPTESAQFLRWFLENIFRQDSQEADDACVDKKQDKGIDGILVNDVVETVFIFQSKVKQSEKATLGDTDLKEFYGTLTQFSHSDSIQVLLDGAANAELKSALQRDRVKEKVQAGYQIEGVFCCNVSLNEDGKDYLITCPELTVSDAARICEEHIDLGAKSGVSDKFRFDISDTEVVKYQTAENIRARIFLANALQLLHMNGISDGTLFSQNVRLSLGNTKVNKSLTDLSSQIATLPNSLREEIERDLQKCQEDRPALAMVDSAKGITNFHSPNDVIVGASMPAMIRSGGKMWGADGKP